uniref:EF-hand domain-containing protein n=1 Tax=Acrobeloides nanus TaxID=290746 RepID=A0A914CK84_9BILA
MNDHLGGKINSMKNMTPKQLLFFHVQDLDKNGKLDGDELIKAITDFHEEFHGSRQDRQFPPSPELQNMLDSILRDNDLNMDGHIDYNEFLSAQGPRRHSEL